MAKATHYVELDEAELVCLMIEAYYEHQRPDGMSAVDALGAMPPNARAAWLRVSGAVRSYLEDSVTGAKPLS